MHNLNNQNYSKTRLEPLCRPAKQETITEISENVKNTSIQLFNLSPPNVHSRISQQAKVWKMVPENVENTLGFSPSSQYSDPLVLVPLSMLKPYLITKHSVESGSNSASNTNDSNITPSITSKLESNFTEHIRTNETDLITQKNIENRNMSSRDSTKPPLRKGTKSRKPTRKALSIKSSDKLPTKMKSNPSSTLKLYEPVNGLDSKSRISRNKGSARARNTHKLPNAIFCKVCGDTASKHSHYGGNSCYSCRAFFRRAVEAESQR